MWLRSSYGKEIYGMSKKLSNWLWHGHGYGISMESMIKRQGNVVGVSVGESVSSKGESVINQVPVESRVVNHSLRNITNWYRDNPIQYSSNQMGVLWQFHSWSKWERAAWRGKTMSSVSIVESNDPYDDSNFDALRKVNLVNSSTWSTFYHMF